ncbi:MAG: peptide chain release factor N(5)-glutamine methyltransferase [Crocinitomicaceae bacterium]|nr:peptide chain release factor N(5)-glutamine methyltransferase [Crocinitomicaceae bacterium]
MFVADNTLKSVKNYFTERLYPLFSVREIKLMFQVCIEKRLGLNAADLLLADSQRVSESDLLYFRSVVKRLQANEPFQYIVGEVEFYGLVLKCDKRALIPRPETEELVDWIVKVSENAETLVDICSGSGCIALGVKSQLKSATVVGFDISRDAIDLSLENAKKTGLEVDFQQLDILNQELPYDNHSLDIIVSNPPYVLTSEKKQMQTQVLEHEPHLALFVEDANPLLFYVAIAKQAVKKLKVGGRLFFEINEKYGNEVVDLLRNEGFKSVEVKQDLQEKDRMITGVK